LAVRRRCVHRLRNLERKAPKHALAAIRDDFHRIVVASGQIRLRRIDGSRKIAAVLGQHLSAA